MIFNELLLIILISLLIGLILTHYLEGVQTKILLPVRDFIYFGNKKSINTVVGKKILLTGYKFSDVAYVNPVNVALQIRTQAIKILDNKDCLSALDLEIYEREKVIDIAEFFVKYGEKFMYKNTNYILWAYHFDYPIYQFKAPWYSGMAQGHGIEILLAAYVLTKKIFYLETACLAANALYVPVEKDGVAVYLSKGEQGIWFEEYASKTAPSPMVLNGHNFALMGLKWLTYFDKSYIGLYNQGIKALKSMLPKFDAKVWSRYDLVKLMANPGYHQLHINQLLHIGREENSKVIMTYAQKFTIQKYIPLGAVYRLIFYPHNFLVLIMFFNTSFIFLIILFTLFLKFR